MTHARNARKQLRRVEPELYARRATAERSQKVMTFAPVFGWSKVEIDAFVRAQARRVLGRMTGRGLAS